MSIYRNDDSLVDGNVIHTDIQQEIANIPEKAVPAGDDIVVIESQADAWHKRRVSLSSLGLVGSGSATDHGGLVGLGDDDHPQYHNDARGDARYSQLNHTHGEKLETTSSAGTGVGLALPKVGVDAPIKSLVAGNNITLTDNGDDVTIEAAGGGGGTGPSKVGDIRVLQDQTINAPEYIIWQTSNGDHPDVIVDPAVGHRLQVTADGLYTFHLNLSGRGNPEVITINLHIDDLALNPLRYFYIFTDAGSFSSASLSIPVALNSGQSVSFFASPWTGNGRTISGAFSRVFITS